MADPAAIYVRVSTEEQTENFSINAQLDLLRSYCKSMGHPIYKEYVDPGYSGTTRERPALQELLDDAQKGCFKIVFVYRIDRFFRSVKDLLVIVDHLDQLGVAFRSVTEPFDTSNPIGKFMLSLLGSIAQLERDTFMERSRMGKLRRAKEGYVLMSRALYGYDYNKAKRTVEINEREAEAVRFCFYEYIKPFSSTYQIEKKLKELGYETKFGGHWNSERVHSILRNPAYAGDWYYKHRSKDNPSDWILVPIPPIIDRATFDRVQELLKERRSLIHRPAPRDYLLRGLLRCKKCGGKMGGTTDVYRLKENRGDKTISERHYYRCLTSLIAKRYPERNLEECGAPWVRGKELEDKILEYLIDLLNKPEKIREALSSQTDKFQKKKADLEKEISDTERKISRLETERERLLHAYREGVIELKDLSKEIDAIKSRQRNLEQKLSEMKLKLSLEEDSLREVEEFLENATELKDWAVKEAPFEEKRNFIERIVKEVWVETKTDGTIHVDIECLIPISKENEITRTPLAQPAQFLSH